MPRLILCMAGNRQYVRLAQRIGYEIGARLPATVYAPLRFADQEWKRPNRAAYMAALAQHRPQTASVLDWEYWEQRDEVLNWAEEAAQHVTEAVIIIPKVRGGIATLPRAIGGRAVYLGYSVPTSHGATTIGLREFAGWPLHILGGSPRQQMQAAQLHRGEVVQADGNMVNRAAGRGTYWYFGRWKNDGAHVTPTSFALLRSLIHIRREWDQLLPRLQKG